MGEKKKHKDKDRERSEQRDKKKSKKKKQQKSKDKQKLKKRKSDKKGRSSSSSPSQSSESSSERSRSRDKASRKKKKEKEKEKQQKPIISIPFAISQPNPIMQMNPLAAIRPVGGIMIPPPVPTATTAATTSKPKTKQYHIFKLLPKLPLGAVTIGRTIYSSSLFSIGFENKMLAEMCQQLEKTGKAEGSKKMSNMIGKVKQQINSIEADSQKKLQTEIQVKNKNQFQSLNQAYSLATNKIKKQLIQKRMFKI